MKVLRSLLLTAVLALLPLAGCMQPNSPPTARFTASPSSGQTPLFVNFDAASSTDADGYIAAYTWSFGDGSSGSGITASHTYSATGNYSATLVVRDDEGDTDSVAHAVSVAAAVHATHATHTRCRLQRYCGPDSR
jgi:PKD repeat protein